MICLDMSQSCKDSCSDEHVPEDIVSKMVIYYSSVLTLGTGDEHITASLVEVYLDHQNSLPCSLVNCLWSSSRVASRSVTVVPSLLTLFSCWHTSHQRNFFLDG
jgi:hypothetical protein